MPFIIAAIMLALVQNELNCDSLWDHSFNTYLKISEKLTLLPPDTHTFVFVSGGKKCEFFGKFCVSTKLMIP